MLVLLASDAGTMEVLKAPDGAVVDPDDDASLDVGRLEVGMSPEGRVVVGVDCSWWRLDGAPLASDDEPDEVLGA